MVLDDADDHIAKSNSSAYTQYEEHQKEKHGEKLRYHREFRQGFRVGYESETCPGTYDAADIVATDLVSEIAQDSENGRARH